MVMHKKQLLDLLYIAVVLCVVIGQLYADKCDYHTKSLRCRWLQYAVFVGINGWHGNNIFSIFSVSCYGISLFKALPKTKFVNCLRKDSKNTKRTYKVAQQVFHEYLWKKAIAEPTEKSEVARVLKRFYVEVRRRFRYHVYFLRLQCIIEQLSDSVFVICKIINVDNW